MMIAKRRSVKMLKAEFVYDRLCSVCCDQQVPFTLGSQRILMSVH